MPLIKINNQKFHVLELNETAPDPIIMIHGMFTNLSVFYFNIATHLAKTHHIIMYDLRSHGLSEKVKYGYDLKTMSNDLISLMNFFKIQKANLVGYSFGGLISLFTAIHHPELTQKIAIIDSPITDSGTDDTIEKYGNEFLEHYMQNYSISTQLTPNKRQLNKSKKLFDFLLHETTMPKDLIKDKDFSSAENMKSIHQEILLLYGNQSDCLKDGKLLNKLIPNSKLYEGNGDHNLPVQNPEWISKKLMEFFD